MVRDIKVFPVKLSLFGQHINLSILYLNCICLGLKSLSFNADTVQETVKGSRQGGKNAKIPLH